MPDRITPPAVPNTTIDTGVPGRRIEITGTALGPSLRVTNTDTGRSITANLTGDEPHRIAQALAPELGRHPIVDGRVEPGLVATGYITVAPIEPTDCDRTTVYAGECRNFAGTEWIPFEAGRRRSPDARDGNTWLVDCANDSFWTPDRHIRNLVRLVPARPDVDVDRWRRARDIAVAERDAAREERDAERAKCEQLRDLILGQRENVGNAIDAQRAAVARAERAERERDGWKARAEQAEARTAPAVTREDVAGVIDHWIKQGGNHEALLEDLWRWVSGDDPAVFVVRESDLPEVGQAEGGWSDGTRHGWEGTAETAMGCVETHLEWARFYFAAARAIEAGQATDPIEAKARELWEVGGKHTPWSFDELSPETADEYRRLARHVLGEEADQ